MNVSIEYLKKLKRVKSIQRSFVIRNVKPNKYVNQTPGYRKKKEW